MEFYQMRPQLSITLFILCFSLNLSAAYLASKSLSFSTHEIEVCFEHSEVDYSISKNLLKKEIPLEFAKAEILLKGWKDCHPGFPKKNSIRVRFNEDSDFSITAPNGSWIGLGTAHDCKVSYMNSNCFINTSLHEFGHALGLKHEMNRKDMPVEVCHWKAFPHARSSHLQIGDLDHQSIMNYCHLFPADKENKRISLSPGDIDALREIYFGHIALLKVPGQGEREKEMPNFLDLKSLKVAISGKGMTSFQYKLAAFGESCLNESPWLGPYPISHILSPKEIWTPDLPPPLSHHRICALGIGPEKSQKERNYSSFDFQLRRRE